MKPQKEWKIVKKEKRKKQAKLEGWFEVEDRKMIHSQ